MNNMAVRIIVAVIAGPVILYSPFAGLSYFTSFIFIISFLGSKEILNFYRSKQIGLSGISPYLASFIPIIFYAAGFERAAEFTVLVAFILFFFEVFRGKEKVAQIVSGYILMLIYCGIFPSMLIGAVGDTAPSMFIFIYGIIIATDTFAYFGGLTCSKMFKTHKLLERVSPKKTIEGSISGLLFAVLTGWMIASYTEIGLIFTPGRAALFAAAVSVFGQTGDLFESMIKRDFNIKDSSNIIPGHGGILDRFDSLIFVSPAAYLYLKYFLN
jgi:phosphatidate cytidylyltransferase